MSSSIAATDGSHCRSLNRMTKAVISDKCFTSGLPGVHSVPEGTESLQFS